MGTGQVLNISSLCETIAAAMPSDGISEARWVRQVLLDPNFRIEGLRTAEYAGETVGLALALSRQVPLENAASDSDRGYITLLAVHPQHQGRGIGSRLLEEAETHLRDAGCQSVSISPYAPGYFLPGVDVRRYAPGLEFLLRRGYSEVYRPLAMEIPLWDLTVPGWVVQREKEHRQAGLQYLPYSAEWTLALLDFARSAFAGDWVRVAREGMARIVEGQNPERLFLAIEDDQVVGYSHFDNERFGPIGVSAEHRGRGIGQILMYKTLQAQQRSGFRSAWFLWSDDKTAERLYLAAGFRETRRYALLRKDL
jgi:mycothiol synthase